MSHQYTSEQRMAGFMARVNKDGPIPAVRPDLGPCWLWTGKVNRLGYGNFWQGNGKNLEAHRFLFGPVPEGLELDHLCMVPNCVRPSHLEAVTHQENIRRAYRHRTHCKYGHPFNEANTKWRDGGLHRMCRACSNERYRLRRSRLLQARSGSLQPLVQST